MYPVHKGICPSPISGTPIACHSVIKLLIIDAVSRISALCMGFVVLLQFRSVLLAKGKNRHSFFEHKPLSSKAKLSVWDSACLGQCLSSCIKVGMVACPFAVRTFWVPLSAKN